MYLSSKAQASFNEISPTMLDDYDSVMNVLLNSYRKWWSISNQSGDTYNALYLRINSLNARSLAMWMTKHLL